MARICEDAILPGGGNVCEVGGEGWEGDGLMTFAPTLLVELWRKLLYIAGLT